MSEADQAVSRALLAAAAASFVVAIVTGLLYLAAGPLLAGPPVPWLGDVGLALLVAYWWHAWLARRAARRQRELAEAEEEVD